MGAFTRDERVIALGATLLAVAAIFQLFDGIQGVATGILRGLGDTRTPMAWNLVVAQTATTPATPAVPATPPARPVPPTRAPDGPGAPPFTRVAVVWASFHSYV